MTKEYERLCVSKETYKRVVDDCVAEFRSQHPEMDGIEITQDYIVRRIVDYYLA